MKLVREQIEFQRGIPPKKSIGIGKEKLIEDWIKMIGRFTEYTINPDFTIDVHESVYLNNLDLLDLSKGLPDYIQFNMIEDNFDIDDTRLNSLRGCPLKVYGYFSCQQNNITDLEFMPQEIEGDCYISNNKQLFTEAEVDKSSHIKGRIETDDSDDDY